MFKNRGNNILLQYTEKLGLVDVLYKPGIGENESDHIVEDGFGSIQITHQDIK